ncbi:GWxTD domain-containing protein [Melioribacter sp. OK-6-Me]|uniref:GWxTD domain-containing protein n=1 Tax=unclassified Melioribacter TaxID=2627329 RepID=UPI003ED8BD0B
MTRLTLLLSIIFLFLIKSESSAQCHAGLFIEKNLLRVADSNYLYISIRIPYERLVFIKKQNNYVSGYSLSLELFQKDPFVERKTITEEVIAKSYEQTESNTDYSQAFTHFLIKNGDYYLIPTVSYLNSNKTEILDTIFIRTDEKYFDPVIIDLREYDCDGREGYLIANYGNQIPFSSRNYGLIIPLSNDIASENLRIKIEQNQKVISDTLIDKIHNGFLSINKCNNDLYLLTKSGNGSYVLINSKSSHLYEGKAKLSIYKNDSLLYKTFLEICWIDKPTVLHDVRYAVDIMEAVFGKDAAVEIKKNSLGTLFNSLVEYWNKHYPSGESVYNGLMNEFYRRADYAENNFSTMTEKKGALSDRGIVYIKFGKPDRIERDYSDSIVKEYWYYENIDKQFIFVDEKGLGNYRLEK